MKCDELSSLLEFDRRHVWHPYASATEPPPVNCAVKAAGSVITLADGTELIDGLSSWWCVAHGHNHPRLTAAIREQLAEFCQIMFAGFTHAPAVELSRRLLAVVPEGMSRVFFADSGSIAVEVAVKMALQYQFSTGHGSRTRMLTVRGGYHGDTVGTMALSDPDGMHGCFAHVLPRHIFAPVPPVAFGAEWDDAALEPVAELLERHENEIAGMILEPIFQGAGGMRFYHPAYLRGLRELCDRHGVLLVLDEVATGFGRTGKFFAAEYAGISPDIMCVGKALTGGTVTLAATLCNERVAAGISEGAPGRLMHGPTFMANPLACAAGCASLALFEEYDWAEKVRRIEAQLRRELTPAGALPAVAEVRVLGAVGVIELKQAVSPGALMPFLLREGVWLRPIGRYLYTMPPFVISASELSRVTGVMVRIAAGDGL